MRPLLVAIQFLTRTPIRLRRPPTERELGQSVLYYPLVGLGIGGLVSLCAWWLAFVPPFSRAALVLTAWVTLTGALHLDGLADTVDAWGGGDPASPEHTLRIMKDPNAGPMGVVAVVLVLLLKFAALASLFRLGAPRAILWVPVLGRTAVPLLFLTTPYVRPRGLGAGLAAGLPRRRAWIVVVAASAVVFAFGGVPGIVMTSAAGLTFLLMRTSMRRRLGGTTGDTAGALVEVVETAALVTAIILIASR